MPKKKRAPRRAWPAPQSDGEADLRALGLSGIEIVRRTGLVGATVSRYLTGKARPDPQPAATLHRVFGIAPQRWLGLGVDAAMLDEPAPAMPDEPPTMARSARDALIDRYTTSTHKIAAAAVCLRDVRERVDTALAALTERERVTARSDFGAMRDALLATVAAWPAIARKLAALVAEPEMEGAYFALLEAEQDARALEAQLRLLADQCLSIEGVSRASQYDSKRAVATALAARAGLDEDPTKLVAGGWWRDTLGKIGNVLRTAPGALEAVQLGFAEPSAFGVDLLARIATVRFITWPATQFQTDPVGFVRTILGVEPEPAQVQILESVRDHGRTSCASGRRVGKTDALGMVALWRYGCFAHARVFITAPTERQVERVDWICVRRLFLGSGVCAACRAKERVERVTDPTFRAAVPCPHSAKLDGALAEKAKTGLRSEDLREISGFTSKQAEDVQGLAGSAIMFIADEASGVKDPIFEAIEGNLSGGGRLLLLGNPTQNQGEHYESFYKKRKFYSSFRVSSMTTRNYAEGRALVPGLATREWVEEMREMHGEDSAYFKIHVLGEHAIGEDGRLNSVHTITEAEERWFAASDDGELVIGLDPAGAGGEGDESTLAVRRGQKLIEIIVRRGLDDDGHLSEVLALIKKHRRDRERTLVNVDIEGVGAGTSARLRQYAATQPEVLAVRGIKSSAGAVREPLIYERIRDEMGANFARWLKHGGSIPTDTKLAAELHALELKTRITARGERVKLIPKEELRKILRRSPDRYDACALACWELSGAEETLPEPPRGRVPEIDPYGAAADNSAGMIDPYAGI